VLRPRSGAVFYWSCGALHHLKKLVEEMHTTKVRQAPMITGDSKISWRSAQPHVNLTKG